MAAADVQQPPAEPTAAPTPGIPDYLASPNAVLGDKDAQWRYGRAPDYSKTRKVWEESKKMSHEAGSLPQLVENLVKNWEVEASFKPNLADWRTVNHDKYTFAINGGPPQSAEHMLKVGTYNAIIAPNEYYSPEHSDFASSHKTFKRMMPTFAWEVLEVYSGPPTVAFKWRHWGTMKNDYVGFNDKGEKVTAKAHGGDIDITGITVATVDDQVRLQEVNTYFDPLEMFRQIAPEGVVNKQIVDTKIDRSAAMDMVIPDNNGVKIAQEHNQPGTEHSKDAAPPASGAPATTQGITSSINGLKVIDDTTGNASVSETLQATDGKAFTSAGASYVASSRVDGHQTSASVEDADGDHDQFHDAQDNSIEEHLEKSADTVHPHPKDMERAVNPHAGEAVAASADSTETRMTHEEMSRISPAECPFLMNRE